MKVDERASRSLEAQWNHKLMNSKGILLNEEEGEKITVIYICLLLDRLENWFASLDTRGFQDGFWVTERFFRLV